MFPRPIAAPIIANKNEILLPHLYASFVFFEAEIYATPIIFFLSLY